MARQIVICSGTTVTVITLDAEGNPVEHREVCPDYGLTLFSATAAALPDHSPLTVAASTIVWPHLHQRAVSRDRASVRVRGPPLG
ncbi:hypothetical protein [Maritimibacter sp. 55A14]|uniref:hypothetical protein n=1 Tax=Maritimibacter sp. 55A14 TaxID=2174844 RepID=UPI0011B20AF9|nr:hypothetical protein [Maritimibacter sp. 55A14]